MNKILLFSSLSVLIIVINSFSVQSQNIAITDDDTYVANSSAMLDVKSVSKGLLIPRLTTAQRNGIASPASGLLVFDTNLNSFYHWNGTSWTNLTSGNANGIWEYNSPYVYLNNLNNKLGVGTSTPFGKMEVKSDVSLGINDPIFQVVNNNGDTVFAVYQQGVRVNVEDSPVKATSSKGGFAVGGFSPSKGTFTNEFLRVTPDSVRIYIENNPAKATTSKGGFAVGGFSPSKTSATNYLDLTPDNYFIGHDAGKSISNGKYNLFLGFESGKNTINVNDNTFLGYQSGYSNTSGESGVFIGYKAGYANTNGTHNVFIGPSAGIKNIGSSYNTFIGIMAGANVTYSSYNTMVGCNSGYALETGTSNAFFGVNSGYFVEKGIGNTFIGSDCGRGGSHVVGTSDQADYNSALGFYAAQSITSGCNNVLLGYKSGRSITSGTNNSLLGFESGSYNISGSGNVFLGFQSGYLNQYGANSVFIGNQAGYSETNSNKLYIENTSANSASALIYGEFDNNLLRFNANVGINIAPDPSYQLKVSGNTNIAGDVSATSVTSSNINGLNFGKIFLNANGSIVSTRAGTHELYWDKASGNIVINNTNADYCDYWCQSQKGAVTAGNSGAILPSTSNSIIISGVNTNGNGFEIHFGQADGTGGWCSVWLQYANGNLVGHYIIY